MSKFNGDTFQEFHNIVRAAVAPQSGLSTGGASYSRPDFIAVGLRTYHENEARRETT